MAVEVRLADGHVDRFGDAGEVGRVGARSVRHAVRVDGAGNLEVVRWTELLVFRSSPAVARWGASEHDIRDMERDLSTDPARVGYYPAGSWTAYRE